MSCSARPPCDFVEVPLEDIEVQLDGPAVGRKAVAFPARRQIFLDEAFWRSLRGVDERAAILAHERGHIEGARCESCADRRAGEILRREGHTQPRDAARALLGRLENRDGDAAANDLLDGYGLDDLPSGPGYLLNVERARGVRGAKLLAFLRRLHAEGLTFGGVRYSVTVGVDGGVRTNARQGELYARGRSQLSTGEWTVTDAAKVVTHARTVGQSRHGSGDAVDLWVMLPSGAPLLFKSQARALFEGVYRALGELGESVGLVWGGRWTKLVDLPHFQESSSVPKVPKSSVAALSVGLLLAAAVTVALTK